MPGSSFRRAVSSSVSLFICAAFTAAVGLLFWRAWHPPLRFFVFNLPLAPAFAAFFLDRAAVRRRTPLIIDGVVLLLALARVFVPPFPFVSGHVLFSSYAAVTARGWVLRATASAALLISLHTKLVVWGDWKTPLGALAVAAVAATLRARAASERAASAGATRSR